MGGFLGRIGRALTRLSETGPPRLEVLWPYSPGSPRRVGLVSGSFDPMTLAHAALADALGATADLVLFLYSPATLPKEPGPGGDRGAPLLDPRDRVASLLAYSRSRAGRGVALCSHGLYADQAAAARDAIPGADIVFGVGSDKVLQLLDPAWYGGSGGSSSPGDVSTKSGTASGSPGAERDRDSALDRLFSMARVAYAVREGEEDRLAVALDEASPWRDRMEPFTLPPEIAGLSSRRVREEVARGRDVAELVPAEVMPFIERRPR